MRLTLLMFALVVIQVPQSALPQSLIEDGMYPFEINFPQDVNIGTVQVSCFIAGKFGGYGERGFEKSGGHRILLHTQVKGTSAESLKAIVYVPGCQIVTVDVPDLVKSTREMGFHCRSLPAVAFRGRIAPGTVVTDPKAVVDISYEAFWSLRFFGIADGSPSIFHIATAPLEPGSIFHAELPDLSKDPLTKAGKASPREAGFRFTARDSDTWNILGILVPPNARWNFDNLPIQPEYPLEVVFTLHKI